MPKSKKPKAYLVEWEETHVYRYSMWIEARTPNEAKRLSNSHDDYDKRTAEFDRVKSVGRKKVVSEEEDRGQV